VSLPVTLSVCYERVSALLIACVRLEKEYALNDLELVFTYHKFNLLFAKYVLSFNKATKEA
jgi:hypothetical protein